jgi:hypothetical protein
LDEAPIGVGLGNQILLYRLFGKPELPTMVATSMIVVWFECNLSFGSRIDKI